MGAMLPFSRARSSSLWTPPAGGSPRLVHVLGDCPPNSSKSDQWSPIPAPGDLLPRSLPLDLTRGSLSGSADRPNKGCGRQYPRSSPGGASRLQDILDLSGDPGSIHQRGSRLPRLVYELGGCSTFQVIFLHLRSEWIIKSKANRTPKIACHLILVG
jgi:hypothetical protein